MGTLTKKPRGDPALETDHRDAPSGVCPPHGGGALPRSAPTDAKEPEARAHLSDLKEFLRLLSVAQKNYALFPVQGKVVRSSLSNLSDALKRVHHQIGILYLSVTRDALVHGNDVVYREENASRSIAYRMYKDGVRAISFLEHTPQDELSALLSCFRVSPQSTDDEQDFATLFWERDCTHIQVEVTDALDVAEASRSVPPVSPCSWSSHLESFRLDPAEDERLKDLTSRAGSEETGDPSLELAEDEIRRLQELAIEEEACLPLCDFVDVLFELIARNLDLGVLKRHMKLLRNIIFSLLEDLDFEHASQLILKLQHEVPPGLPETHRAAIRRTAASFCDKATLMILSSFLKESSQLPEDHAVFRFLRCLGPDALPSLCEFLGLEQHVAAISKVLLELGTGRAEALSHYLQNPDPLVVRAMIPILTAMDKDTALDRIAVALKHPDESARVEAAKTLLENATERLEPFFLPLIQEPCRALRIAAFHFFAKVRCPSAYEPLVGLTRGKPFCSFDLELQEQCFAACLRSNPQQAFEYIRRSVIGRGFCWTEARFRRKAAALRALRTCRSDEAVALLLHHALKRRSRLAPVAQDILRSMKVEEKEARTRDKEAAHV